MTRQFTKYLTKNHENTTSNDKNTMLQRQI